MIWDLREPILYRPGRFSFALGFTLSPFSIALGVSLLLLALRFPLWLHALNPHALGAPLLPLALLFPAARHGPRFSCLWHFSDALGLHFSMFWDLGRGVPL